MKKKRSKNFILGAVITGFMMAFVLIGCVWTPYDPEAMDKASKLAGVSVSHIMGCDDFGRETKRS